jgi:transposase
MPAHQKEPLRALAENEKQRLEKISRCGSWSADQVARAKELLMVAKGKNFAEAARLAGRRSGDAVAHLVSRFNKEGLQALVSRHGGGPAIVFEQAEKERILREFKRQPERRQDGTAAWSLKTLQRALQRAPDGFKVGTSTLLKVLHEAGYTWQKDRSWCDTGIVLRQRKSGPVEVSDPDLLPKKN